jgi:CheY-like chemotaxis protein
MSHEIRTPMTAILGFSESLLDATLSDAQKRDAITTIRRNGEYLLEIINDILDLSKIEAGKLDLECIAFSPCRIIDETLALMRVRADAKQLPLHAEYDGKMPETIRSDPTRLRQILINLVGNAIKFTPTGSVRLVTRCVVDDVTGPMLQFDVVDTGIGMSQEQMDRLFNAFTQADTSTTRRFGGTGLGLNISRRLSHMLGGDVTVTSRPGQGSTFRLTLSAGNLTGVRMIDSQGAAPADALTATAPPIDPNAIQLRGRVLLAEDGPDNQRLISFILAKAGLDVTVANNGKVAVELALDALDTGEPMDVILMDMQMPVMDGYEATSVLRRRAYNGPIIALTAHAMAGDREKCEAAGCDGFATKPIDRASLLKLIQSYVKQGDDDVIDTSQTEPLLSDFADEADMLELIQMFVDELPERVATIEKAMTEQDLDCVKALAHQLKGSAGGYGFPSITQIAGTVEGTVKMNREMDQVKVAVDALIGLCRRAAVKAE